MHVFDSKVELRCYHLPVQSQPSISSLFLNEFSYRNSLKAFTYNNLFIYRIAAFQFSMIPSNPVISEEEATGGHGLKRN
jgi:hypothetical protein